jgi:4-amino-4-deoxy-L-arabinose transferase-like glycosyltransferase
MIPSGQKGQGAPFTEDYQSMKRIAEILPLLCLCILAFWLRSIFFSSPLFRDEGNYGYNAQVMHQGGLLYHDVCDNKPPGLYFLYYTAQSLFGWASGPALRIFVAFFPVLSIPFMYLIVTMFSRKRTGLFAALLFAMVTVSPKLLACLAFGEVFMLFPVTAAYYLYLTARARTDKSAFLIFLLCGISLGGACSIKQVAFFFLLPLIFHALLEYQDDKDKRHLYGIALVVAGFAAVIAAFFAWLLAKGIFGDFVRVSVSYNSIFSATNPDSPNISYGGMFLASLKEQFVGNGEMAFLMLLSLWYWLGGGEKNRRARALFGMWFLFAFLGVCLSGRFFTHYYIQVLPPLVVSASLAFDEFLQRNPAQSRLKAVVYISLFLMVSAINLWPFLFSPAKQENVRRLINSDNNLYARELARFIDTTTGKNERIFMWCVEFEVYYYSNRCSASRHINLYDIVVLGNSDSPGARELFKNYQDETIADFKSSPPRYFIVGLPNLTIKYQTPELYVTTFVDGMLQRDYAYLKSIGPYDIFERKKSR